MAQFDVPILSENASGGYIFITLAPQPGQVIGFNASTSLPELCPSFAYDASGNFEFGAGHNLIFGTSTGTQIGTTTSQKLAFFGATAIVQPAAAAQGALTDSTTGAVDGTLADVTGSFNQAILNGNFADIASRLNAIRTVLVNLGLMKGSA